MGILDFVIDKGKALIGAGNEAEEIQNMLNEELPGKIDGLKVEFNDGIVALSGEADSQYTIFQATLLAGNVKGVKEVTYDSLTSKAAAEEGETKNEFYTIESGDSLSKIAKKYYGDANEYPKIFEANREVIKDVDLIYPGQKIRIPL